ncbi:hypothetical protein ACH4YO_40610 [Streptomyces noursei]|uniref:hypothetical protein n=1 Tax=Streptomyces noursei TaxID=1971 RepID=UPI00081C9AE4|nr:hypothetical protein SNOUR_00125 [Streptomyces noursei ATCC 11455]ANZ21987.1 hypothetical protein SNOUR_43825 [Streptomyces noursei ATCC 11455]MCZ0996431.1 hypothetical protein [Streptomyces noursei]
MSDPIWNDMRLVSEPLRLIAYETAAMLGPEWRVEGILSSAIVVHPIGFRIALDDGADRVLLTAHVSISRDKLRPLEDVTAVIETADDRSVSVQRTVQAIRTEILPHFGREDAVAGLRVLSLPLRDAGINAIARPHTERTTIEYKRERLNVSIREYEDGERRPLHVIITAPTDDSTRVEIRLPHLSVREAARITQGIRPVLGTPMKGVENLPKEYRATLAVTFPGLIAKHVVSDMPRYTDLQDVSGVLTIRHALAVTREETGTRSRTWAAVWLRNASVAQAYTVLSAYAS